MGCDGDGNCKCGEKKDKVGFDSLAELERFMKDDLIIDKTMVKLPKAWVRTNELGAIKLQFCGWAISLNANGTWFVEDTRGG